MTARGVSRRVWLGVTQAPLTAIVLAAALLTAAAGRGEERFPPPDFTSHKLPDAGAQVTQHSSELWQCLDLTYLVAAMGLASYLALVRRSRRGLFVLSLVSLAWLGFWRQGCVCPIGAIQNVSLAVFDSGYTVPLVVVAILLLPLLFTLFFGRTFCAAVCPLGAVQELVAVKPIRVPAWLDHALGTLAYVYLGAAVALAATGTSFLICRYDPFVALFRRTGSVNMLVFGISLLVLGVFVGRPYCRYLCPLGAILGVCSKAAKFHLRIPPERCIQCRLCEDACPYGAILEPTVAQRSASRGQNRRRLLGAIVATPLLMALGGWLGSHMNVVLGKLDPVVRLAERVRLEELAQVEGTTDASDAFRNTGRARAALYREGTEHLQRMRTTGLLLGGWIGLVLGVKLVHLSIRRRRSDFEPDRAGCISCGRCFWYCPDEHARQGLFTELPMVAGK